MPGCLTTLALFSWMVHRLLHYFSTAAMQDGLKSHYLSEWDHRNLLHVWPLKAFPHYRSQVRIYWNQFFILRQMAALRKMEMNERVSERVNEWKNRPFLCEKCSLIKGIQQSRWRWAGFESTLCVLSSQIKETLNRRGWGRCRSIVLNQGRNTKPAQVPQRITSKGASHFVRYLIS